MGNLANLVERRGGDDEAERPQEVAADLTDGGRHMATG